MRRVLLATAVVLAVGLGVGFAANATSRSGTLTPREAVAAWSSEMYQPVGATMTIQPGQVQSARAVCNYGGFVLSGGYVIGREGIPGAPVNDPNLATSGEDLIPQPPAADVAAEPSARVLAQRPSDAQGRPGWGAWDVTVENTGTHAFQWTPIAMCIGDN